jgi:hypothetical protein
MTPFLTRHGFIERDALANRASAWYVVNVARTAILLGSVRVAHRYESPETRRRAALWLRAKGYRWLAAMIL